MTTPAYEIGQRVQLHPATDAWMQGDRYGEIVKVQRTRPYLLGTYSYGIKLDSGRIRQFVERNILDVA